jgi:F-type H+-transporting ATPase subunit alpha
MALQTDEQLRHEVGYVRSVKQYLLALEGLPSARINDIITDEQTGKRALIVGITEDSAEAMLLDPLDLRPGQRFALSDQEHQLAFGDYLLGRVVNTLGEPIDGKTGFPLKNVSLSLENEAKGISFRDPISQQFLTGMPVIDTLLPIGKGQRQLLMGPVRSGIDVFLKEVIKNQEHRNTICIYAAIGRPLSYIRELASDILQGPAASYTVVLAAPSDETSPLISIAPSVALLMAEYFRDHGKEVLLILDDLYTHAKYLREIALLQGRLPGRESYPGDIFYQHSHLIERAGNYTGKGPITLLPVLQSDIESSTDLITTNVMGATDGHLSFSATLFSKGVFPPIVHQESVTRVGKHTQLQVQKELSTAIMLSLAQYREQERYTHFGGQGTEESREILLRGTVLGELLSQEIGTHISHEAQAIVLGLPLTTFLKNHDLEFFKKYKHQLYTTAHEHKDLEQLRHMVGEKKTIQEFLKQLEGKIAIIEKSCQ